MEQVKVLGADTYMEKHMFTQLKYEIKADDIVKNRDVALRVKQNEIVQAERAREFRSQQKAKSGLNYQNKLDKAQAALDVKNKNIEQLE